MDITIRIANEGDDNMNDNLNYDQYNTSSRAVEVPSEKELLGRGTFQ